MFSCQRLHVSPLLQPAPHLWSSYHVPETGSCKVLVISRWLSHSPCMANFQEWFQIRRRTTSLGEPAQSHRKGSTLGSPSKSSYHRTRQWLICSKGRDFLLHCLQSLVQYLEHQNSLTFIMGQRRRIVRNKITVHVLIRLW